MFCGTYSAVTLSSALLFLLGPGFIITVGSMQYAAALSHTMRSTKKLSAKNKVKLLQENK